MDASIRRPSSRVHRTLFAFTLFTYFTLALAISPDAHMVLRRRDIHIRQADSISNSTSATPTPTTFSPSISTTSVVSTTTTVESISSTVVTRTTDSTTTKTTSFSSSTSRHVAVDTSTSDRTTSSQAATEITSSSLLSTTEVPTTASTSTTASETSTTTSSLATSTTTSFNSKITPATTLVIAANSIQLSTPTTTAVISDVPASSAATGLPNPASAASTSSSFWQKKAAVAATFIIVSLVFLAVVAYAFLAFMKRRSKRMEERFHEDVFEKYSESDHRSNSPGPSINAAPMDAFASRPAFSDSAFYDSGETRYIQPAYTSTPRYISPSESQSARAAAPPTAFRNPIGRTTAARDSHPVSIDSFYGAAGQPAQPAGYAV